MQCVTINFTLRDYEFIVLKFVLKSGNEPRVEAMSRGVIHSKIYYRYKKCHFR